METFAVICLLLFSQALAGEPVVEETHDHGTFGKIFSHKFVVPRGDDEAFVEKICRKIPWMVDNPISSPPPQSLVSVETAQRRVDQLGECCSYNDVDRAECFDSLRQGSADEYCEHQRLTTNIHLLTEHPCCIQTGTDRLMCIDKMKYGYEEDRHAVDYSEQLDDFFKQKFVLHAVEDLSMCHGKRMDAADTEQYCARQQKKSLKSKQKVKWGYRKKVEDIKERKTKCCEEATLDARQRCMQGVFQTQVNDYCAWMDVRAEGDFVTKIDEIAANQPDHMCCGLELPGRYDCFGQLTSGGYNPYVDSRDFTYIINPYKEQYRQFQRENNVQMPMDSVPTRPLKPAKKATIDLPQWWEGLIDVRSHKFTPPPGEDLEVVQAVCLMMDKPPRMPLPPIRQPESLRAMFSPTKVNIKEMMEARVAAFKDCCSRDENSRVDCFNGQRERALDEQCELEKTAPHRKYDIAHPCCEVNDLRLECFDQQMYGYDSNRHIYDFSSELDEYDTAMFQMKSVWPEMFPHLMRMEPRNDEQEICALKSSVEQQTPNWAKKLPKWGLWKYKEETWARGVVCCALTNSWERQDCLDKIRGKKNNQFCEHQQEMSGVKEGPKIVQILHNQPQHPCCQVEGVLRSDCFDQEEHGYSSCKHPEDFTLLLDQYKMDFDTFREDNNIILPPWVRDDFSPDDNEEIPVNGSAVVKHWALLVAGSYGWDNYRDQAGVCYAYQILRERGIPEQNIVVMMTDDIAYHPLNPTKGKIINRPGGPDVYKGVPKDYTGRDVTPENFLRVLQGDAESMRRVGSGKVIRSGPNDRVFVYFADHGSRGLVTFPIGVLHARLLSTTLKMMHTQSKYKELVFYMEASESGSMFAKTLPRNIEVLAMTSANTTEPTYACYWDKERGTFVANRFSITWMEDSATENICKETLQQQFMAVKSQTKKSHVGVFGFLRMKLKRVSQFLADLRNGGNCKSRKSYRQLEDDDVAAPDVPIAILNRRLEAAQTEEERQAIQAELQEELDMRKSIAETMKNIVTMATDDVDWSKNILGSQHREITDHSCYEAAVDYFHKNCYDLSQYDHALRHLYALVNLCEEQVPLDRMTAAMDSVC